MNYAVLTICLNSAATIQRSIDSVLAQDPLPDEYIFVDGGSQDNTLKIIDQVAIKVAMSQLPIKFNVIHQEKKSGISGAWNLGLQQIKSDLVFLLNSDDWYEKDTVAEVIKSFTDHPEAGIVAGAIRFHDDDGTQSIAPCRSLKLFPILMPIMHPGCFVKKSVYDQIGLFDEKYPVSMDYEFVYRAYHHGIKFHLTDQIFTNMQLGGNANSRRAEGRTETRDAALAYYWFKPLPYLAYLTRLILGR